MPNKLSIGGVYVELVKPQGEDAACLEDLRLPPFLSTAKPKPGDDGDRGPFWVGVGDRCDLFEEKTSFATLFPVFIPFAIS